MKSEERESWPAGQSERVLGAAHGVPCLLLCSRCAFACPVPRPCLSCLVSSRLRLVPCAFIPLSDKRSASLGRHYQTNQADTVTHNQDTIKGRGLPWSGVTECEVTTASSDSGVKNCDHLQLNTPPHEHSRTHTHSYMQAHTQTHNTLAHTHAS